MSAINRLTSYIEALRPILYIPTFDFYSFDNIISKISENEDIYERNEGLGYVKETDGEGEIEKIYNSILTDIK